MATSVFAQQFSTMGACVLPTPATNCPNTGGGGGGSDFSLTLEERLMFKKIQDDYTSHLSDKQYQNIPNDLILYLNLLNALSRTQNVYSGNNDITLLMGIVKNALEGAFNAYGMNVDIIRLTIDNQYLEGILHEYMSGRNRVKTLYTADGGYSILKGFDFAPLFKYYIQLYGLPSPGQGFDLNILRVVYNTLIQNNIDPGVSNIDDIPPASECVINSILVKLYAKLSAYIDAIKTLNQMYYSGQVAQLQGILTTSVASELMLQISELAVSPAQILSEGGRSVSSQQLEAAYAQYENIRVYTATSLGSLNVAVRQYDTVVQLEQKIESDSEKLAILLDPLKLQEYIQTTFTKTRSTLPEQSIQVMAAKLKPQYARYVELYGYPAGGAFDPIKLAEIMKQLGITAKTVIAIQPTE